MLKQRAICSLSVLAVISLLSINQVRAQSKPTFHIGVASVMGSYNPSNGDFKSITNSPALALPIGVNKSLSERILYDIEFLPVIDNTGLSSVFLQHGVFYSLNKKGLLLDLRSITELTAFQTFGFNLGINQLLFFPLDKEDSKRIFVVLAAFAPWRFGGAVEKGNRMVPSFAIQIGISF